MRKIYTLTAILLLFVAVGANAQVKYGVNAGLSHSSWKGDVVNSFNNLLQFSDGMITTKPSNGIYAGGFAEIPLGGVFSIQPGLYYAQKGYGVQGAINVDKLNFLAAGATAEVKSHYIDMPVLLKAEVAKGLQVYAGPQLSYLVRSDVKMDAGLLGVSLFKTKMDITDAFNQADFGLTGGASYTFDNGFSLNASYDHGLSRLDKNSHLESFNRGFKVGVGFRF
jgi:hypothetical protein